VSKRLAFRGKPARSVSDDIDGADMLIYGAHRLSEVKPRNDVFGRAAAADRHRGIFVDAR
jgi:hypothetical protein